MPKSSLPAVLALIGLGASTALDAGDWPGLRGPAHDGTASARLSDEEGSGFDVAWRRPLGSGYSSVAVAEGRAVTLFSDG
ncbi:MAG TPA: hypothetical protein VLL75_12160, partial [Vicinamibacteria bacterium]|nr:hypothetical protein [Vicinamibacteria bacterium]